MPVNHLLYSLTYANEVNDELINFNADSAVQYTTLELGPQAYYQAIEKALTSRKPLDEMPVILQFDQAQIASFLRGVLARLDELRPWRDPKVRRLNVDAWEEQSAHMVQIARLDASVVKVTGLLQKGFRPVGNAQPGLQVLMLRLGTGETVALLGYHGPDQKVVLLTDATNDRSEVIEHFASATGFPADKVIASDPDAPPCGISEGLVMKRVTIAFDIDGTLRDNTFRDRVVANERIRTLLITLSSMRNTQIMLWSGGGAAYAREIAAAMAIEQYVDVYEDKGYGGYDDQGRPIFHTSLKPDIAFDDIHEFMLGAVNLIVDENGRTPGYVPPSAPR